MDEQVQVHALVAGKVQGVGFRYFVRQQANAFQLGGWVRNKADGCVELIAEGQRADLETLLAAIKRGPAGSAVSEVIVDWRPASGLGRKFSIAPTE